MKRWRGERIAHPATFLHTPKIGGEGVFLCGKICGIVGSYKLLAHEGLQFRATR